MTALLVVGAVWQAAAQDPGAQDAVAGAPLALEPAATAPQDPPAATPATPSATDGQTGGRMFGVLPNYTTVEGATTITPLSVREKFALAKMNAFDPVVFPFVGVIAAFQRSYGPGAVGYAKQYAASLADNSIGNIMTTAVLPSVLHLDPRYFQRGHGSIVSRVGYAASRLVVTRADAGPHRFNIAEVGGNGAVAAISNTYYPAAERTASATLSRWAMQLMWDGLANELKEFWPDVRRMLGGDKPEAGSQ